MSFKSKWLQVEGRIYEDGSVVGANPPYWNAFVYRTDKLDKTSMYLLTNEAEYRKVRGKKGVWYDGYMGRTLVNEYRRVSR